MTIVVGLLDRLWSNDWFVSSEYSRKIQPRMGRKSLAQPAAAGWGKWGDGRGCDTVSSALFFLALRSIGLKQAAEKVGKADPSRAKLYPNKRKNGACRGPLFARS